jgi:hypothetical protein
MHVSNEGYMSACHWYYAAGLEILRKNLNQFFHSRSKLTFQMLPLFCVFSKSEIYKYLFMYFDWLSFYKNYFFGYEK